MSILVSTLTLKPLIFRKIASVDINKIMRRLFKELKAEYNKYVKKGKEPPAVLEKRFKELETKIRLKDEYYRRVRGF